MERNIAVFCGSSRPRSAAIVEAARQLGRRMAEEGLTLVYGGSNLGLMGEVSGAALQAGGRVVGIIPTTFSEEIITSQSVTELVRVNTITDRKVQILRCCQAFVALPGGIGTIDEVSEVMVANQLGLFADGDAPDAPRGIQKPMVLLNVDGFYDPFLAQLELIRAEGLMRTDGGLRVVTTVGEVMECVIC